MRGELGVVDLQVADVAHELLGRGLPGPVRGAVVPAHGHHVASPEPCVADRLRVVPPVGSLRGGTEARRARVPEVVDIAFHALVPVRDSHRLEGHVLEAPALKALVEAADGLPRHARDGDGRGPRQRSGLLYGDVDVRPHGVVPRVEAARAEDLLLELPPLGLTLRAILDEDARGGLVEAAPASMGPRHPACARGDVDGLGDVRRTEEDVRVHDESHVPPAVGIGQARRLVDGGAAVEWPHVVDADVDRELEDLFPAALADGPGAVSLPDTRPVRDQDDYPHAQSSTTRAALGPAPPR